MTNPGHSLALVAWAIAFGACKDEEAPLPDRASGSDAATDGDSGRGDADGGADCAAPDPPAEPCSLVPDPCLSGHFEIGSGEYSFVPVDAGDDVVELIHGPQGGYHVFGSFRVRGIAIEPGVSARFHFRAVGSCEDMLLPGAEEVEIPANAFRNTGDGYRAAFGYFVILNITDPYTIDGGRFVLGAEVTDAAEDTYRDEVELEVHYGGD